MNALQPASSTERNCGITSTLDYLDFAPVQTAADLETAFRDVAARYAGLDSPRGRADLDARAIEATIYDGAYGPAGLVLAINGSPPRGTFLIPRDVLDGDDWAVVVYLGVAQRVKTLSGYRNSNDYRTVVAYARALWTAQTRRTA